MQKILKREAADLDDPQLAWVVALDKEGTILNIELISRVGFDEYDLESVEILSVPIQKHAATFVLIQGRPGKQLYPTEADEIITARLIKCGDILQMPMFDHLLINGEDHFSFREKGLMSSSGEKENTFEIVSQKKLLEEDIKTAMLERRQITDYIVWLMNKADYTTEDIMARTGLSEEEVMSITGNEEIDPDSHYESTTGE